MTAHLISVVDDDYSVRESLDSLIRSVGLDVRVFPSAEAFLESTDLVRTACLILDIHMPGMDGVTLRRHLRVEHPEIPVIFITAHGFQDDPRASQEGVLDFLLKPLSEEALLNAVYVALGSK